MSYADYNTLFTGRLQQLRAALEADDLAAALALLDSFPAPEQAELLDELAVAEQVQLLPEMTPTQSADLLAELDESQAARLVTALPAATAARIIDEMAPNIVADVLGEMAPLQAAAILDQLEDAAEIRPLLLIIWANSLGALLPMAASALRIDPTVVSGPATSTLVDATGLFIYFTIARLIMGL